MLLYQSSMKKVTNIEQFHIPSNDNVIWAHINDEDTNKRTQMLDQIDAHPLIKKAIERHGDMPKIDVFKNHAYISIGEITSDFVVVPFKIIVGKNFVLTIGNEEFEKKMNKDFTEHPDHMSHTGHVLYHVIDKIMMSYLAIVDRISNHIQSIEKEVFKAPFSNYIGREIYRLKAQLHHLRQQVEAQENVIKTIGRSDFPYINEDSGFYFQDITDHISRVLNAFDTFKENASGIFDLQMSLKGDHMNAIMKTLTMVSVVFLPMTFIAGLYGMNFERMPELKWIYGYSYALILMFCIGGTISIYFKKKGWW